MQCANSNAAVIANSISGNWSNSNTWGGASPNVGDDVVISAETIVNLNESTVASLGSLTIQSTGVLIITVNSSSLKINGNIINNGQLTTWVNNSGTVIKGTLFLNGNSNWSGTGNWNLGQIDLGTYSLEFDNSMIIYIAENIDGLAASTLNNVNQRSDVTLVFNGIENANMLAKETQYYYPNITIDKMVGASVSFVNSTSNNTVKILGQLNIIKATDKLELNQYNSLIVDRNVLGSGTISGSITSNLTVVGIGSQISSLRLTDGTSFLNISVTRPTGVVFKNSFIVRNEIYVAANSSLTLPSSARVTLGINGATPTEGKLTCNGLLYCGTLSSLALHGNGTLPIELVFSQFSASDYTLEDLDLSRVAGAGTVKIPATNSIILNGALSIDSDNNFNLGNGKLYLNKTITIAATSYFTGSELAALYVQGSGGNATLRFNPNGGDNNRTLKTFYLNRTPGRVITLSNTLNIKANVNVISGKLNSNGYLTLLASASQSANLGALSSSATMIGNVNIQSYFTGLSNLNYRKFRAISTPINDVATVANGNNGTYKQLQSYVYITGPNTGVGFDVGGTQPYFVTLKTYNEPALESSGFNAQYNNVPDITTSMESGKGTFMFYRGDRSTNKLNDDNALPENTTVTYTGIINRDNIAVPLSYTNNSGNSLNGFNLVGNPYPCTIDWQKVLSSSTSDIADKIYILKPMGGFSSNMSGVSSDYNVANQYIQSGQAFYVQANSSNQTLTFTEDSKVANQITPPKYLKSSVEPLFKQSTSEKLKSTLPNKLSSSQKIIHINLEDQINTDGMALVFAENKKNEYDPREDAIYFGASTVAISSLSIDDKSLSINFLPPLSNHTEVRLNVNAVSINPIKMKFYGLSGFLYYDVFLKDNYLDAVIDIGQNPEVEFSVDRNQNKSFGKERFVLLFEKVIVPPIELISFEGKNVSQGVELRWLTQNQTDCNFIIERSSDGINFLALEQGKLLSDSLFKFKYIDISPLEGLAYYRLKQSDIKGRPKYSEVLNFTYEPLVIDSGESVVSIFPNPCTDVVFVSITDVSIKSFIVEVYNLTGQKVKSVSFFEPMHKIQINVEDLASGNYILHVFNAINRASLDKIQFNKQ